MSRKYSLQVACAGNANDVNCFGGLPYHLIECGKSTGLIEGGIALGEEKFRILCSRYLWNTGQYIKSRKIGGFQYSEAYLNLLWSGVELNPKSNGVLNIFQLFPARQMQNNINKYFYLDQTIHDVLGYYEKGRCFGERWRASIIDRERSQYMACEKVIFRSRWAADRAKGYYGLRDDKVAVVLPGANISQAALLAFDRKEYVDNAWSGELKLIFIGKEWKRKGLDRLLHAMRLAKNDGALVALTVVGVKPDDELKELSKGLSVSWIGYFNKSSNPSGFIDLLAAHHIGVLLSRSEAGGVSLREFGRAGLPVIAPDTGGSPEFAMSETAHLFAPDAPGSAIAEVLITLAGDRRGLDALKRDAWARRREFDWCKSLRQISCLL